MSQVDDRPERVESKGSEKPAVADKYSAYSADIATRKVYVYCGTCEKQIYPETRIHLRFIGRKVECSTSEYHHVARVVWTPAGEFWAKAESILMKWFVAWSPINYFRVKGPRLLLYLLTWFLLLVAVLALWQVSPESVAPLVAGLGAVLGFIKILDFMLVHAYIAFTAQDPENVLRSVVLALINLLLVGLSFAPFYLLFSRCFETGQGQPITAVAAVQLSLAVLSTVGYSDVTPVNDLGRFILIANLTITLAAVLTMIPIFVQWAGKSWNTVTVFELERASQNTDSPPSGC